MVYQIDDSWHKNAEGQPVQWVNALRTHGVSEADAQAIVQSYISRFQQVGLNYDLGLAQACQESAWFTSAHWVNEFNPCGLGITGDDTIGVNFGTIEGGVTAHAAHLCCYVYSAAECPIEKMGPDMAGLFNDPRHIFHDGMDKVADLERPGRKWAFPGDGYVAAIVNIANSIVGNPQTPPPPIGVVRRLTDLPIDWSPQTQVNVFGANGYTWPGRAASPIRAVVCHVMDGTYDGSIGWANNPASAASFNFAVAKDGRVACVVDPRGQYAPWANAVMHPGNTQLPEALNDLTGGSPNSNFVTVSIEHEGHPFDQDFPTAAQLNASTELCAAILVEYGLSASRDTITGHFQWDPVGRPNCPGPNFNLDAYVARVQSILAGTTTGGGPSITLNGHTVAGGFLGLWSASSRPYQTFGLPLDDEHDGVIVNSQTKEEKNVTVQTFDRQTMVHDSSVSDTMWQDTTLQRDWKIKG